MTLKGTWVFTFETDDLSKAAREKIDYHLERIDFWNAEMEIAERKAREAGFDIRTYDVTGGKRLEMVVDPSYADRYQECFRKIERHTEQVKNFERYERAFELNPNTPLNLDVDDIKFFGL